VVSDQGADLVVGGPVIVVDLPSGSDQNSLAPFIRWLGQLNPAVTAAIGDAFPDGLNLGDAAQAAALDHLLVQLDQPQLVGGWDGNALGATSVPEPGAGVWLAGAVGIWAARRRRQRRTGRV
jgi:hypothetical protein